jgi:hypothetical protein
MALLNGDIHHYAYFGVRGQQMESARPFKETIPEQE